jgi:hypothetical protein
MPTIQDIRQLHQQQRQEAELINAEQRELVQQAMQQAFQPSTPPDSSLVVAIDPATGEIVNG